MKNLVNFTVGNDDDKVVKEYTFERVGSKLVITEADVAKNKGDAQTVTTTKIAQFDKTTVEISVGSLRKTMKIVLAILVILVGVGVICLSFLKDTICQSGKLAGIASVFPWLCYIVGGFVVIAGLCWFISGVARKKKVVFTEIDVKCDGEIFESVRFRDNPQGEIASNIIDFFRG